MNTFGASKGEILISNSYKKIKMRLCNDTLPYFSPDTEAVPCFKIKYTDKHISAGDF